MTKLPLAPGVDWDGDDVVEGDGTRVSVTFGKSDFPTLRVSNDEEPGNLVILFVSSALAVIRRKQLDPEFIALEKIQAVARAFVKHIREDAYVEVDENERETRTHMIAGDCEELIALESLLPAETKEPSQ